MNHFKNIVQSFAEGPQIPNSMLYQADLAIVRYGELSKIIKNRRFPASGWIKTTDIEAYIADPISFEPHTILMRTP